MTAERRTVHRPSVRPLDGTVRINRLSCTDPDLAALVADASDAASAVQHCLVTGARALRVAHASVDTAVVERSFAALESQLRVLLDDTTTRVAGTTADLLTHPEHGVVAALDRVTSIKRAHAAATRKITEASRHVGDLAVDLTATLDRIEQALATAAPDQRSSAA